MYNCQNTWDKLSHQVHSPCLYGQFWAKDWHELSVLICKSSNRHLLIQKLKGKPSKGVSLHSAKPAGSGHRPPCVPSGAGHELEHSIHYSECLDQTLFLLSFPKTYKHDTSSDQGSGRVCVQPVSLQAPPLPLLDCGKWWSYLTDWASAAKLGYE